MRKKRNLKFAKLGFIFVILIVSLASIGISYSHWSEYIRIKGTITTGTWNETAWARMYDYPDNFTYEFPGNNWATYMIHQPTESEATFYLYAAQEYRVGELHVWKDSSYLYVEYDLDDDYDMSESQLHVATSLEGIPQSNGNPIPGQFDHKEDHDPHVTEYTYEIPWDTDWDDKNLYIAAHAVVWGFFL